MLVYLLKDAECKILEMVQELSRKTEILKSNARSGIPKSSNISQLDAFFDNEGMLHAGARLVWIPAGSILCCYQGNIIIINIMIITSSHKKPAHGGREYTVNFLGNSVF